MAMSRKSDARLGLAEFLTELQVELTKARLQTAKHDLHFSLDRITVDVDVSYTLTSAADSSTTVKPQFWVMESEANADERAGSAYHHAQRFSVQLNRRPAADAVDTADEVATIPVLGTGTLTKPNQS
jgi:hypothetical protein